MPAMERCFWAFLVILVLPFCTVACPGGANETYCANRSACVSSSQNCTDGDISSCVNETSSCIRNGTVYCVDLSYDTCANISCDDSSYYCSEKNSCINLNESCCSEHEETCADVVNYITFFKPGHNPLDMICDFIAAAPDNFSVGYNTTYKYDNPFKDGQCTEATYFCPLNFGCIPLNETCDSNQVFNGNKSFTYFDSFCETNKTFCPLIMNCLPDNEQCNYKKLFDWYASDNTSIGPFGESCPLNQSFSLLTFDCQESSDVWDIIGNRTCDNSSSSVLCPDSLECVSNKTYCNTSFVDFNDTVGNFSGWLEVCKYRPVLLQAFYFKYLECKPLRNECYKSLSNLTTSETIAPNSILAGTIIPSLTASLVALPSAIASLSVVASPFPVSSVTASLNTTDILTVSPTLSPSPPLVLSTSPPLVLSISPPLVLSTSPPLVLSTSPPLVLSKSPPLVLSTSPPLVLSSSPPLVLSTSPILVLSTSPPLVLSTSPPLVLSTSPPLVLSTSPPLVLSTSPPLVLSTSPPLVLSTSPNATQPPVTLPTPSPTIPPVTPMSSVDQPLSDSCELRKLCPRIRSQFNTKDDFDTKMNTTVVVGECNITMNMTVKEICNISDVRHKLFFNGFKISDSVKKDVSRIAVRLLGVSNSNGTWQYKTSGDWISFGAVSADQAMVLETDVYLRFSPDHPCWHGLATLRYTPVESGSTGTFVNVSDIPEDHRNTLSLMEFPPRPMANFVRFKSPVYTVPEDTETSGILISDKIVMNMSCEPKFGIPRNEVYYLDEDILEEYNETISLFKSFGPSIAIVKVGSDGIWKVANRSISSASVTKPTIIGPLDLFRFVPFKNFNGNSSMKFVPVVYTNHSNNGSDSLDKFDPPQPLARAFKGIMMLNKTSKEVKMLVKLVLRKMASNGTSYSLQNFNSVVDNEGSARNKSEEVKNIAALAFDRASSLPSRPIGLPRTVSRKQDLVILNNFNIHKFAVIVTPTNDQPIVTANKIILPSIGYNLTATPNTGKRVSDITTEAAKNKEEPLITDIDGDACGIAVVQAQNTSLGSWYYRNSSTSDPWTLLIVDNGEYKDSSIGEIEAFLLEPEMAVRFQMHSEEIMWTNVEAMEYAKMVFLAWDRSSGNTTGRVNIPRPSDEISLFSKRSVMAVVQRIGCDGRTGSKGRFDRCEVCGGDGDSCLGCDGVLNSGAIIDNCRNCTGGKTNKSFDFFKDCAGQCGLSYNDSCGVCQREGKFKNFTDCNGECFGGALINDCGVCAGGSTGKPMTSGEDVCGVCNGTGTTCLDCDNVPNGGKVVDLCGQCLLRNDSRLDSKCVKLKKNKPESGPSLGNVLVVIQGAGLKNKTSVNCQLINTDTNSSTAVASNFTSYEGVRVISFHTRALPAGIYKIRCTFDSLAAVYEVLDTTYLVYNKSLITYTSVTPSEGVIRQSHLVHISGSGFVNTTDLACITHVGHVFAATFIDDTNVSCVIPVSQKSARFHMVLSFSRADRIVGSSNVTFTLYADAPQPLTAKFLNDLRGILVHFDRPAKPASISSCSAFFDSSNVTLFGSAARCMFRTPLTMIIVTLGRPTIAPGDSIAFSTNSVVRKFQKLTKTPTSPTVSLVISGPDIPIVPKAVLTGSSLIGACAPFKLNGGQSFGGGGRRLKLNWTVNWEDPADPNIDAAATADLGNISSLVENVNGTYDQRLRLESPALVFGISYQFTLRVTNFLGVTSSPARFVVKRENRELPELDVGAAKKTMRTALGATLQGKVKLSPCLTPGSNSKVAFSWEIQAVGIDVGLVDRPRLMIRPGLLLGGMTYTLTLTVSMQSDPSLSTTAEIQLEVLSSPLQAVIKGGDVLIVGEGDTFILDASRSVDPDGSTETATYEWLCFDSTNDPCFEPDPANPRRQKRMVIPSTVKAQIPVATKLQTSQSYTFKLIYRKGTRNDEASITVHVKSGAPPKVLIRPLASPKINPTEKFAIRSLIKSKKTITATWTCIEEDGYGYIDLTAPGVLLTLPSQTFVADPDLPMLVASMGLAIDKNKLANDVNYKFRLTVEHTDASSYSEISVKTNAAPTQGTLVVKPASGFFGNTTFTFVGNEGWTDDAGDLPLTFRFGYFVKDDRTGEMREELLGASEENTLEVPLLPQGDKNNNFTLSVFLDVSDIYGATTRQTAEVVVRQAEIDAAALTEIADGVESDFEAGDLSTGAAKANAVVAALSGSGTADADTTQAIKELKNNVTNQVLSAVENGGVQDESSKDVVKGCLLQMTSGCQPACNASRVAKNIAKMEGAAAQTTTSRRKRRAVVENEIQVKTGGEASTVLEILANVIVVNDYSNASMTAKKDALLTMGSLEQSLCKGLTIGEPAEIAKSNLTVIRAFRDGLFSGINKDQDVFMEVSSSSLPEYVDASATFLFGQSVNSQYDSWSCTADDTCTGTCIASAQFKDDLLITHDPSDKNLTRVSDVVSIRLYNPETLAYLPISGFSAGVRIRFPVENASMYENYTMECRIWYEHSQEWSLNGCDRYEIINSTMIECTCNTSGYITVFKGEKIIPTGKTTTQPPTSAPTKPEEAIKVEFAFSIDYNKIITGNTTKAVFIAHLRPFMASLLNISTSRISNMDIRNGSIIVTFLILPSNDTNEATNNATAILLQQLVSGNDINFTVPNSGAVIRVDPTSFKIVPLSPQSTTVAPTTVEPTDDDDGLSDVHIAIIAVLCSLAFLFVVIAILYYCLKVKPSKRKVSPRGSEVSLGQQPEQQEELQEAYVNNNVEYDEKAV